MRATMERARSWVKAPAPPPPRASPSACTPRSSRSRSRPGAGRRCSETAPPGPGRRRRRARSSPPRAAFPHPPRREAAARTFEEVARAHPGGHEARILARDGDQQARRPARLRLRQRRLVAEPAQHPLLAHERRRVVDAEQDLALHDERLGPAAGGHVDVAQPAREARALGVDGARALERVGGGAEIARALGRLGEEHEEPWLGPGLLETLFEELARPGALV